MRYLVFCMYPRRPSLALLFTQVAVYSSREDAHITQEQYNQLGTVFYIFYLAAEFPQNFALQRFPVAKVLALNITLWAVLLLCHAAAKSFAALTTVRTFLALTESAIMPGFMVVTGMFYTREEAIRRVGWWCEFCVPFETLICTLIRFLDAVLMDGVAVIALGLIAYGTLHIETGDFRPWQWLNIIFGAITLIAAIPFWYVVVVLDLDYSS